MIRTLFLVALIGALAGCGKDEAAPAASAEVVRGDVIAAPYRDPALVEVTADYGPLSVREGQFHAIADIIPWSGSWFPVTESYVSRPWKGEPSPLTRYDAYRTRVEGVSSKAQETEEKLRDPRPVAWQGLCDAWSIASILEPEPRDAVEIARVRFTPGHLKALLVKTYELVEGPRYFGQRNNNNWDTVYEDMYPDQFHRFFQHELFEKRRPFVMDTDAKAPVWNTPIFEIVTEIRADAEDAHVMHVRTVVQGASPHVSYEFLGTFQVLVGEYTYDLFGNRAADGRFEVTHGAWTGMSREFHPDFVTMVPEKVEHMSLNSEILNSVVYELLKAASSGPASLMEAFLGP